MHLKTTRVKGYEYLSIVQSYRDNGKVKHKTIVKLGRADVLARAGLKNIIKSLQRYVTEEQSEDKKDIRTIKEKKRVNFGYLAYRVLWKRFQLDRILKEIVKNRQIEYNFPEIVISMVINRLFNPSSKLQNYFSYGNFIGLPENLKLQHFYRALDILAEKKEYIEKELFILYRNIFNYKLDIVFYDVTTYYFESQRSDNLRDFGFSKDNKVNEVQVVMGLLIDKEGRPIGYELFSGNTFEGKTLVDILKKLSQNFKIDKVIIVADRGLNSKLNLKEIKQNGFDYIVSARIKNMSATAQELILKEKDWKILQLDSDKDEVFKYKVLEYTNHLRYKNENGKIEHIELEENLICTYSSKRAAKDRYDRDRAIEKAKELIMHNNKAVYHKKNGYKQYIKELPSKSNKEHSELVLNDEKISQQARFDGYYAIHCSDKKLSAIEVIQNYHYLFKIEESFRILKTSMKARPIYLWKKAHVSGHFMVCFLAFLLERELEYLLKKRKIKATTKNIKTGLKSLEFSEIEIENNIYYMRSNYEPLGAKIFALLKLKLPPNIISKEKVNNFVEI